MEMSECASFNQMCSSWNSFGNAEFYCGGSTANENVIPMMKMYFHSGIVDYVLFQGWVPTKGWQYGLTWTFIAILGIGAVAGRASLAIWEKSKEAKAAAQDQDTKKKSWKDHLLPNFGQFQMNLIRASFLFPILVVEFCLMLVAMTFNVGLFFAVILGYCFGIVLFGHVTPSVQTCCTK
jgi:copper transporter 1